MHIRSLNWRFIWFAFCRNDNWSLAAGDHHEMGHDNCLCRILGHLYYKCTIVWYFRGVCEMQRSTHSSRQSILGQFGHHTASAGGEHRVCRLRFQDTKWRRELPCVWPRHLQEILISEGLLQMSGTPLVSHLGHVQRCSNRRRAIWRLRSALWGRPFLKMGAFCKSVSFCVSANLCLASPSSSCVLKWAPLSVYYV